MQKKPLISIIVPFYNAEKYIENFLTVIKNVNFKKPYEILMVNDGSTDNSFDLLNKKKINHTKLFSMKSNLGPSAARNFGLKNSIGEYVFFFDIDDEIEPNTLNIMYDIAVKNNYDVVICDKKWIDNSKNKRENIFIYNSNQNLGKSEIMDEMRRRFYNTLPTVSLFDLTGRLIRRSIITDNNLFFDEKLRYMEDQIFSWYVLAFTKSAKYIKQQLYSRHVYPNLNTAVSDGLSREFPFSRFKLYKSHIKSSLEKCGFIDEEVKKLSERAYIYFIISALVSLSVSIISGKLEKKKGIIVRRKLIENIITEYDVSEAIKNYSCAKDESPLIIDAILKRSKDNLEFACIKRAEEVLYLRKKGIV